MQTLVLPGLKFLYLGMHKDVLTIDHTARTCKMVSKVQIKSSETFRAETVFADENVISSKLLTYSMYL